MKITIYVNGETTFPVEDYEIIAKLKLSLMSFGIKESEITLEKEND